MSLPKDLTKKEPCLNEWAEIIGWRGSIAHGMYVPPEQEFGTDDKDIMVVCIPPVDYYCGLEEFGSRGTKEIMHNEWDIVIYEAQKFLRLLEKGNPNVLSLLWLPENMYLYKSGIGQYLIDNRDVFACKSVYHSFVGYAKAQLHKMERNACKGYMGEKRKRLVEKFGYDTKNASHLIRLLRMGMEFLVDGELHVEREDAKELLDIKMGKWTLSEVKAEAEELFKLAREAYVRSTLPVKTDHKKVNQICVDMVSMKLDCTR